MAKGKFRHVQITKVELPIAQEPVVEAVVEPEPEPDPHAHLPARTRAEMEAGRKALANHQR